MENLKRVIERYIQTKNTFYALLINGDWGCGKTFFIKANYFKKQQTQLKINGDEQREPQFCYISLNGLTKTDDIMAQFTAELLSARDWKKKFGVGDGDKQTNHFLNRLALGVTKNAKSIFDKALDKVGFKFENIIEFFEHGNCVIFIDDLERCKLPIEETLGYINTHFVEHAGLKVIFLANEREIISHDKNQTYQTIKEKIIGRTIEFEATLEENLISIVEQYSNELQRFVKKHKDVIINVISLAELNKKHNLRTLQFAFEMFEPLLKLIQEEKKELFINENQGILESILKYFLTATYVYKSGISLLSELLDIVFEQDNGIPRAYSLMEQQKPLFKYKNTFILKNIKNISQILNNYIELGYFEKTRFITELDSIIKDYQKSEEFNEYSNIKGRLSQLQYLNFEQFKIDVNKMVNYLTATENPYSYKYQDFIYLMEGFIHFIINNKKIVDGIIPVTSTLQEFICVWTKKNIGREMSHDYLLPCLKRLLEHYPDYSELFTEWIHLVNQKYLNYSPKLPKRSDWFEEYSSPMGSPINWLAEYSKDDIQKFSMLVIENVKTIYERVYNFYNWSSLKMALQSCTNPEIIEQLLYDLEHSYKVETDELIRYKLQIIINLLSEKQEIPKEND